MEEVSAAAVGRRRRPPRKKPANDQTETQNNLRTDNNTAPQQAPDSALQPQNPRRQRTRTHKKQVVEASPNDQHAASPPATTGSNSDTHLHSNPSQAPTWQQQQSFLSAEAPDFQPNFESLEPGVGSNNIAAAAARPKPRQRTRKKKAPPQALSVDSTNELGDEGLLAYENEELLEEAPHCLLCCSPMALASFGSCGHLTACGACCLRLRMCYKRTDCSVCKSELSDVVIAPWRPDLPDFTFFLDHPESVARSRPGQLGPGCILADKWHPKNRKPSSKLLHDLERSTGIACSVCDKAGAHPFPNHKELAGHVFERHNKHLCGICFREGRTFPLDLPLYPSKNAVKEHERKVHPRCDFCRGRTFFDSDALWSHMVEHHHRCHLCDPGPGGSDSWFADTDRLRSHLAADHFACDDGDCAACLVAFRTAEELRRHHIERHSARMPRWNPAAARPMQLDIQFVRRPTGGGVAAVFSSTTLGTSGRGDEAGSGGGSRSAGASGRGSRRRGRHGGGSVADAHQQQGHPHNNRFQRHTEFAHETEGGIRIIDDDLGMLYEANNRFGSSGGGGGGGSGYRNSLGFGGYTDRMNGNRNSSNTRVEAFPSLAASAAEALADAPANDSSAARRPPPLVKHTVRCPCGRRVTYPVIEEGQPVPTVSCDAVCRLEGRKKTLADAFGVDDPDRHISSFERRAAVWSGMLLDAAKRNPSFILEIEKELQNFIANKELRRHALPAMNREQRLWTYGIAEQYGVASAAMGVEPRRFIELFKTGDTTAGIPSKLLSKMALTLTQQEISAMLEAATGFPIRFLEIAPTTDLQYYLRRWEPRFKVEWQGGSQATVTFEKEDEMKEALDSFGGGIRGLFRIDRSWHPRTGVSTTEAASKETHLAPWAGDGNSASGSGGGSGEASGQWRSRASGFPCANATGGSTSNGNKSAADGDGSGSSSTAPVVPTGWAVIGGGKKAVKPRVIAPPAPGYSGEASSAQFSALRLADDI